tara:strand:+ start:328 stop:1005 length:678 start_codon:yes stop_codon:yes gene_type:complete
MKTFNKTLIAATTIAAFGLAAAPSALALEGTASVATTYLFRGVEMNSGSAQVSVDVSGNNGGLTYGVWVSSGDALGEYDLYLDYSGSMGDVGYSVGFVDYNYSKSANSLYDTLIVSTVGAVTDATNEEIDAALDADAGLEEAYVGFAYGPASVTYYDRQDSDYDYTVFGLDAGAASFAYGRHDMGGGEEMDHFDVSYAVNDSVSLTVSKAEDLDTVVVASYSVSF